MLCARRKTGSRDAAAWNSDDRTLAHGDVVSFNIYGLIDFRYRMERKISSTPTTIPTLGPSSEHLSFEAHLHRRISERGHLMFTPPLAFFETKSPLTCDR